MPGTHPRWEPSERLDTAFGLARQHHAGQSRKTADGDRFGIPYIAHLMAVTALVIEHGGTEKQAVAALLHDSLEDTEIDHDMLAATIGRNAADIVRACTDTESKETDDRPWPVRKQEYLDKLGAKVAGDPSLLVALADKVHNAESTAAELRGLASAQRREFWSKFNAGEVEQRAWYQGLARVFNAKSPGQQWRPLADRFDAVVAEMFP